MNFSKSYLSNLYQIISLKIEYIFKKPYPFLARKTFQSELNNVKLISSRSILLQTKFHNRLPISSRNVIDLRNNFSVDSHTYYVCCESLKTFSELILPSVRNNFVLVTGDSDLSIDNDEIYKDILEHPRLVRWYAQNLKLDHPKAHWLPIGLDYHTQFENPKYFGETRLLPTQQEKNMVEVLKHSLLNRERKLSVYANWKVTMDRGERLECLEKIESKIHDLETSKIPRHKTYERMTDYSFISSPSGIGMDCHRTYEGLVLGTFPILRKNQFTHHLSELPVCLVDDWSKVTPAFLKIKREQLLKQKFNYSLLLLETWKHLFADKKAEVSRLKKAWYLNPDDFRKKLIDLFE